MGTTESRIERAQFGQEVSKDSGMWRIWRHDPAADLSASLALAQQSTRF